MKSLAVIDSGLGFILLGVINKLQARRRFLADQPKHQSTTPTPVATALPLTT